MSCSPRDNQIAGQRRISTLDASTDLVGAPPSLAGLSLIYSFLVRSLLWVTMSATATHKVNGHSGTCNRPSDNVANLA